MTRGIERAQAAIHELADGDLAELAAMTQPERRGNERTGGGGPSRTAAPAPLDLAVVDLLEEVHATVRRHVPLIRGALRMGLGTKGPGADSPTSRVMTTAGHLAFMARSLPAVWAESPEYGQEVVSDMWRVWGRVQRALGRPNRRPHRIDDPCPECGELSLWVDLARLCVACGMPSCGWREVLDRLPGDSDVPS